MFTANFNGTNLVNLCEGDGVAWDGFVDDNGRDCVSWVGNRVSFASKIAGNGFAEKIMREDRFG